MRDLSSAVVIRARARSVAQSADQGTPPNLNPPAHSTQLMSTSADGSVNGKYDGRSRILRSRSKNASRNPCSIAFMLANVTPSATTRPSTWWNIGECVTS